MAMRIGRFWILVVIRFTILIEIGEGGIDSDWDLDGDADYNRRGTGDSAGGGRSDAWWPRWIHIHAYGGRGKREEGWRFKERGALAARGFGEWDKADWVILDPNRNPYRSQGWEGSI